MNVPLGHTPCAPAPDPGWDDVPHSADDAAPAFRTTPRAAGLLRNTGEPASHGRVRRFGDMIERLLRDNRTACTGDERAGADV